MDATVLIDCLTGSHVSGVPCVPPVLLAREPLTKRPLNGHPGGDHDHQERPSPCARGVGFLLARAFRLRSTRPTRLRTDVEIADPGTRAGNGASVVPAGQRP